MKNICLLTFYVIFSLNSFAQKISNDILTKRWDAYWISVPNSSIKEFGVYHFRKRFSLNDKPASFIVHVSADNRYKLYVNGKMASLGPARGDLFHWNYETVDIAKYLRTGISAIINQSTKYHFVPDLSCRAMQLKKES
jgi:alpha-L-rhamnosidase